ncbi:MAG: hypothetical protein WED09_04275 [Homoserinimonas sp.]
MGKRTHSESLAVSRMTDAREIQQRASTARSGIHDTIASKKAAEAH